MSNQGMRGMRRGREGRTEEEVNNEWEARNEERREWRIEKLKNEGTERRGDEAGRSIIHVHHISFSLGM